MSILTVSDQLEYTLMPPIWNTWDAFNFRHYKCTSFHKQNRKTMCSLVILRRGTPCKEKRALLSDEVSHRINNFLLIEIRTETWHYSRLVMSYLGPLDGCEIISKVLMVTRTVVQRKDGHLDFTASIKIVQHSWQQRCYDTTTGIFQVRQNKGGLYHLYPWHISGHAQRQKRTQPRSLSNG